MATIVVLYDTAAGVVGKHTVGVVEEPISFVCSDLSVRPALHISLDAVGKTIAMRQRRPVCKSPVVVQDSKQLKAFFLGDAPFQKRLLQLLQFVIRRRRRSNTRLPMMKVMVRAQGFHIFVGVVGSDTSGLQLIQHPTRQ